MNTIDTLNADVDYTNPQQNLSYCDKIFQYLIYFMKCRDQLRMNHWQTTSYAEHKATDKMSDEFTKLIDKLGEVSIGYLGRPQITTTNNEITDINLYSSEAVLETLEKYTCEVRNEFDEANYNGIINVIDDIISAIQKGKYLLTLE